MPIGPKIKSVLKKLGIGFSIIRDGVITVSGEFLDYEPNSQITKPFIREHFLEVTFQYDTQVTAGDLILFDEDERRFLVAHFTPELFKNTIIERSGVIYMCNVSGEVQRASGEVDTQTYQSVTHWNTVKSGEYGVLVNKMFGSSLDEEAVQGQTNVLAMEMYISKNTPIYPHDRIKISDTEMYKVDVVEQHNYPGLAILVLSEDTRE